MCRFYLAILIAALMLGVPCAPVHAIGNVLVPTDDDNPPAASDKTPIPLIPSAPPASSGEQDFPAPMGSSDMPTSLLNPGTSGSTSKLSLPAPTLPAPGAGLVLQKIPTRIVKMAAAEPVYDPQDKTLTNSLNVSLQDYNWGSSDIASINQTLGVPSDRVSKFCSFEVVGTLISDTGGYVFDLNGSQSQNTLRYSGKPTGVSVMARAMCDAVPLPPNSGVVLQIGDKYTVFISQSDCPLPPANARNLVFQYDGNGKMQCNYN